MNYIGEVKYMKKIKIVLNLSVNGIPFFTPKEQVRKILGKPDYNSIENQPPEEEVEAAKKMLEGPIKELYKKMGKNSDSFEWPDISEYETDFDQYGSFLFEYNEQRQFVSVSINVDEGIAFELDGKEYSNFDLKTLLSLADDFVMEEEDTTFISFSKQIVIGLDFAGGKVETILFGCPNYYSPEDFLDHDDDEEDDDDYL